MSVIMVVTDKNRTKEPVSSNLIHIVANSGNPGIIEIGPPALAGRKGYFTNVAELYAVEPITISPVGKAYTLDVEAQMDGSTWEKIIPTVTRTGAETELLIEKGLQGILHRYPLRFTIQTASGSDEDYYIHVPVRMVGGSNI